MYKLNRIEDTDIFYFAESERGCLGETLIKGTFYEVLAVAESLKDEAIDIGRGSSVKIENPVFLTDIVDAKWYIIFLASDLIQIVRTDGQQTYSLPTGFECYQEPLNDIFNRIIEQFNK
jgi:hypothetical protein